MLQRMNIFRIMCVAKKYDASLLDRESLERLTTRDLKENLKIDLVLEESEPPEDLQFQTSPRGVDLEANRQVRVYWGLSISSQLDSMMGPVQQSRVE